jgi:hypothetical protein
VGIAYLPDAANGKKQGVDDYLAVGEGTVGDLETTAEDRLREIGAPSGHAAVGGGAPSGSSRAPRTGSPSPSQGDKTRSVRLTGHAVEAFKDHRKRQLKQRLAAGPLWRENDLVFASTVGTPLDDVGNFDLPLFQAAPAARRAPQDKVSRLRHTSATILLSKGTYPKIVQKMLGHATITQTMGTYSYVSASQVSEAQSSSASRYGPVGLVKWSERQSPVKPRSSTARTGRRQRVQLIQYCPSIIIARSSTEASFGHHKRSS